jgi:hypothetical protein
MASGDSPRILDAGIDLGAATASTAWSAASPPPRARSGRKRLKTWEIPSSWLCSIVGTCLMPSDVDRILRRAGVRFHDGTQAYDIHGFMVARASEQGRIGREINKALDDKYAAIVRKVGSEENQERLATLWNELCERNLVAGAYWAIMSHGHIAEELKVHAFGEVHMLSHFMGGYNRYGAKELWTAERQIRQLAARLARSRRQSQETVDARERRIGELEQELTSTRYELARAYEDRAQRPAPASPLGVRHRREERRLAAARARVHALEAENQRLKALVGMLTDLAPPPAAPGPDASPTAAGQGTAQLDGRCVLYVGGRCQLLPHLRARRGLQCLPAAP